MFIIIKISQLFEDISIVLPLLELCYVQEPVAVLSGKLKLGRQWEHGFVEISQHRLYGGGVLMAVVDVIVQTDELPVGDKTDGTDSACDWTRVVFNFIF